MTMQTVRFLVGSVLVCVGCASESDVTDPAAQEDMNLRPADPGGPTGSSAPSPKAPTTRTIKTLHWNIAGAVMNKGFDDVVDRMFDELEARGSDVVSINEGCRDQVEHMRDRLKEKGYSATLQFTPTGDNAYCVHSLGTNTAQAGPAVIAVHGGTIGRSYWWKGTDSVDERTDRGMACLTLDFGKPVRVCSMHLTTADADAAKQAESMLARFGQSFVDAPAILVGDFNASPDFFHQNAPDLYAPKGLFFEADDKENKATHGEGKIDYVFMSKAHFADSGKTEVKDMGRHDPWWSSDQPYSDHRLVASELALLE